MTSTVVRTCTHCHEGRAKRLLALNDLMVEWYDIFEALKNSDDLEKLKKSEQKLKATLSTEPDNGGFIDCPFCEQ